MLADQGLVSYTTITFRILLIISTFILPIMGIFIQTILLFCWQERLYLKSRFSQWLHKHNNQWHDFLFGITLVHILLVWIGVIVFSVYVRYLDWNDAHIQYWNLSYTPFITIVYLGLFAHWVHAHLYLIYNIKKTNSWFGIYWRRNFGIAPFYLKLPISIYKQLSFVED